MLEKKGLQGQTIHSHGVVTTCQLPWQFKVGKVEKVGKVGKRQRGQGVCIAPSGATMPPRDGAMTIDTPTPRHCDEAAQRTPRANIQEPIVQTPPASSTSEGEPQVTPIPYPHPCLHPDPNQLARPPTEQRKRRRSAADLDPIAERRVRRRLDNAEAGGKSNNAPPSPARPHIAAPLPGLEVDPALPVSNPSGWSSGGSAPRVTPSMASPSSRSMSDAETSLEPPDSHVPRLQQRVGADTRGEAAPETDAVNTTLQAANPGNGPVTGGITIWLSVVNPPTNFPLFARFGTNVTAAVRLRTGTPFFVLNPLPVFRKSQHIDVHASFCERPWTSAC